jgi:adenylate cyclase
VTDLERLRRVADLSARLGRCDDLDGVITACLDGLDELFGYEHSMLLVLDDQAGQLFTVASHGYAEAGIGSEVPVGLGQGFLGLAAAEARPVRIGARRRMMSYGRAVGRSYEAETGEPLREVQLPGLVDVQSQIATPVMKTGQVLGVVAVESTKGSAFGAEDEAVLEVAAQLLAGAIELERLTGPEGIDDLGPPSGRADHPAGSAAATTAVVRFYPADGSTFVDGDYLVKGVPGRILWKLLSEWHADGRVDFTNREVRLDPALELPPFKDNLESRLILLKRRLDERDAPVRIATTGRGRFRLDVRAGLTLEEQASE